MQATAVCAMVLCAAAAASASIQWTFGEDARSCDQVCGAAGASCQEGHWPANYQAFMQIASDLGVDCSNTQPGGWDGNPQKTGNVCYWEDDQVDNRCGAWVNEGHRRFCPCSKSGPSPPPPSPPPPAPETIKWFRGYEMSSCTETCEQNSGTCVETLWPNSQDSFEVIRSITNTHCDSVAPGGSSTNPQIAHTTGSAQCFWKGTSGGSRCQLSAASGHNRLCPCKLSGPSPPPPPPPASITWTLGGDSDSCTEACSSSNRHCVEGHWPQTYQAFENIISGLSINCDETQPGGYASNPQISFESHVCYWEGDDSVKRCDDTTGWSHHRICPCANSNSDSDSDANSHQQLRFQATVLTKDNLAEE